MNDRIIFKYQKINNNSHPPRLRNKNHNLLLTFKVKIKIRLLNGIIKNLEQILYCQPIVCPFFLKSNATFSDKLFLT